jgi:hypothetical protein
MSVFVSNCPGCHKVVGVPRPGSVPDNVVDDDDDDNVEDDILTDCPFCGKSISSLAGYDIKEPAAETDKLDLLSVD